MRTTPYVSTPNPAKSELSQRPVSARLTVTGGQPRPLQACLGHWHPSRHVQAVEVNSSYWYRRITVHLQRLTTAACNMRHAVISIGRVLWEGPDRFPDATSNGSSCLQPPNGARRLAEVQTMTA